VIHATEMVQVNRDGARFYQVDGRLLPSVTTALGIIDKSGPLIGWAIKQERRAFETVMVDALATLTPLTAEAVLDAVIRAVTRRRAIDSPTTKALTIGAAAHAGVEWHTRRLLGEDPGPEPPLPDEAVWAIEAWKDWAKAVDFQPLVVEQSIYCLHCGYAGTMDWLARVNGIVTVGDIKTSRGIYSEAFLQNVAYRHAAVQCGLPSEQGMILRLPKTVDDPGFEAVVVPEVPLDDFLAALRLWRWQRLMDGKAVGG
jgi:hypothetical protein